MICVTARTSLGTTVPEQGWAINLAHGPLWEGRV